MDGFTFLRILMAKQPTPVIVVSSYSQKENVFKALELGALDFVAKPDQQARAGRHRRPRRDPEKVRLLRAVRPSLFPRIKRQRLVGRVQPRGADGRAAAQRPSTGTSRRSRSSRSRSSTGRPERAPRDLRASSPRRHRQASLSRSTCPTSSPGRSPSGSTAAAPCASARRRTERPCSRCTGFVCPGRQCMELVAGPGHELRVKVGPAKPADRYVPSADRLLASVAAAAGEPRDRRRPDGDGRRRRRRGARDPGGGRHGHRRVGRDRGRLRHAGRASSAPGSRTRCSRSDRSPICLRRSPETPELLAPMRRADGADEEAW